MSFFCFTCEINLSSSQALARHESSIKNLKRLENKVKFACRCGRTFNQSSSLYRHKKKCNYIVDESKIYDTQAQEKLEIQILQERLNEKDKEMDELRKQVETLIGNTGKNIASNNNSKIGNQNNIQNQQNVNITVNSFGSENIDHITDQIICKLIKTAPFTCVPQLIEKIHFDPEHPENHNIKITNKKLNYAEIVKNNKWVTANKKKVIDDVIQKSYDILDEKYNDNKEEISDKRKERFENFQEKFENEDESLRKNMKNDVDLLLINGTNEVHK
jgi:hypothetical protein